MNKIIRSLSQLKMHKDIIKNPIVLYSGGLDSTYLVTYIVKELGLKPIALRVDVGQSDLGDIDPISVIGCSEHLIDAKCIFANDYVLKLLKNGGKYGYGHFLSASLTRPLLAKSAIETSLINNSNCILHSAVPTQNSLRRFNTSIKDLGFEGFFGSPFTDTDYSRDEKIQYLNSHNISVSSKRSFSMDTNLFCREFEAGSLENIEGFDVPESNFLWTNINRDEAPAISLQFVNGVLKKVNEVSYNFKDAIELLNKYVGSFGIGRQISIEEGPISKVIEVRECPAAFIISKALYDLMTLIYPRSLLENKIQMDQRWTTLACEGHWYSAEKKAIEAYSESIHERVTGTVNYNLSKKGITLSGITTEDISKNESYKQAA
jgi:argininosuccinate synthase